LSIWIYQLLVLPHGGSQSLKGIELYFVLVHFSLPKTIIAYAEWLIFTAVVAWHAVALLLVHKA